jgi:hypothetical protein
MYVKILLLPHGTFILNGWQAVKDLARTASDVPVRTALTFLKSCAQRNRSRNAEHQETGRARVESAKVALFIRLQPLRYAAESSHCLRSKRTFLYNHPG